MVGGSPLQPIPTAGSPTPAATARAPQPAPPPRQHLDPDLDPGGRGPAEANGVQPTGSDVGSGSGYLLCGWIRDAAGWQAMSTLLAEHGDPIVLNPAVRHVAILMLPSSSGV